MIQYVALVASVTPQASVNAMRDGEESSVKSVYQLKAAVSIFVALLGVHYTDFLVGHSHLNLPCMDSDLHDHCMSCDHIIILNSVTISDFLLPYMVWSTSLSSPNTLTTASIGGSCTEPGECFCNVGYTGNLCEIGT